MIIGSPDGKKEDGDRDRKTGREKFHQVRVPGPEQGGADGEEHREGQSVPETGPAGTVASWT